MINETTPITINNMFTRLNPPGDLAAEEGDTTSSRNQGNHPVTNHHTTPACYKSLEDIVLPHQSSANSSDEDIVQMKSPTSPTDPTKGIDNVFSIIVHSLVPHI